ncbi:MAG: hypothetical protein U0556_04710 [Dehalococcoidia bacterium]
MTLAQMSVAQWQTMQLNTWMLFLLVLLGGAGAFSLAAVVIVIPSFRATQAMAYDKSAALARLFPLRPLFLLSTVVLLGGAVVTLYAFASTFYPAILPFWPRVWI